jgi:hypothetical protein
MPETDFSKTSYRGIARAEARLTTPVDMDAPVRVVKDDGHAYGPLTNPDAPSEHGFSPPSPAPAGPPTERQLRGVLEQAIAAKRFASDSLARATETAARATEHRAQCEVRLRDFADLDDRITTATIEGLRSGHGRPMHNDDPLRRLVTERGMARDDLVAAQRAETVLAAALTDAQGEAAAATKAANVAAAALSHVLAEREAERILALEAEIVRLREIEGDGSRYRRPIDKSAWIALRERLLADPSAPLELESVQ